MITNCKNVTTNFKNVTTNCEGSNNKLNEVYEHCCCKACGGRAILKCNSASTGALPAVAVGTVPIPVASISIDSRCLCSPTTVITITGELAGTAPTAALTVALVKCSCGCTQIVGNPIQLSAVGYFTTQICDNLSCDGCENYSFQIISGTPAAGTIVTSQISALVVENECR